MIDQDPSQRYLLTPDTNRFRLTRRQLGQLAGGMYAAQYLEEQHPAAHALMRLTGDLPILKPKEPEEGTSEEKAVREETELGERILQYVPSTNSGRLFLLPNPNLVKVLNEAPNAKLAPDIDAFLDPYIDEAANFGAITSGINRRSRPETPYSLGLNIGNSELTTSLTETRPLSEQELSKIGVMVVIWENRRIIDALAGDKNYDPLPYQFRTNHISGSGNNTH